jgi:signal transduction histidine kinase
VVADGRSVEIDSLESNSPTIDIPAGRGELKFRFAALSFQAPEKNHFAYKLEGVDPDWVNAGTRDAAYYNNIKPGHYVFRVAGRNSELAGNSPGSSVNLTLQPHYWQTWWFKFVSVLASLSLAAAGARFVTRRRMETRLLQLEHQHAIERERARIARDMHDDLGARLTEIRMLSNLTLQSKAQPAAVAAQSRRVSDAAGELIDNLHSIVWAVNPANDSLEKLADYIRGFAQPFLKSSSIRCRFECPTHLPDWPLSSEIRHNIFLVVKEALNNTVKHGEASEVRIALSVDESKLLLSIADNGKGFPMETSAASGNGLQNMEKRIKNIGGDFQMLSEPGKGTRVQLEVPLQR